MILGFDQLMSRINKGELLRNLSERELQNPEGAGFDLRAAEIYRISSGGYLGVEERETSSIECLGVYDEEGEEKVVLLQPGEFYLVKVLEEVSLDESMLGMCHPRSTLFRSGVVLQAGVIAPGYTGSPTFGLCNAGPFPFALALGARFIHLNIVSIEGSSSSYRGQWQGGRVTTDGQEKQV